LRHRGGDACRDDHRDGAGILCSRHEAPLRSEWQRFSFWYWFNSRGTGVLNGSNAGAIMRPARREETAAPWLFVAGIALRDKRVFPIRNRLPSVGPNRSIKEAAR
jgi:hypothetical protein